MRDNSLARELIRQGNDVLLVPIYTPTLTDQDNVSYKERVFFGGISVYLQQYSALFRLLPAWVDKLWDSNWALRKAASGAIPVNPKLLGELTVSTLKGERGFQKKEVRKLIDWLRTQPHFDVIDLPYVLLIGLAEPLKRELKAPVCCTLQGEDLFLEGLQEPWRTECLALISSQLHHVDRFIAVSDYYAGFMQDYLSIPRDKIEVVPLGIDLTGHKPAPKSPSDKLRLGYFARIAPEKGLHVLCEAVSRMTQPVELRAAGYLPPERRRYLEDLQQRYKLHYDGSPDRAGKIRFMQWADVLSVPSTYEEPKGIFLFEAMANGTPVVQPRRGAYIEIISKTRGGVLVAADDTQDLARALDDLARDRSRVAELARHAVDGVARHYTIDRMAKRTLEVYQSVLDHSTARV
jgi:glycosyltransferase involved in cell wall biosynthesis